MSLRGEPLGLEGDVVGRAIYDSEHDDVPRMRDNNRRLESVFASSCIGLELHEVGCLGRGKAGGGQHESERNCDGSDAFASGGALSYISEGGGVPVHRTTPAGRAYPWDAGASRSTVRLKH